MKLEKTSHQYVWIQMKDLNVHTQMIGVGDVDFMADMHYCSKLRYLMVVTDASAHDGSVAAFKALAPNYRALHERCKALDILGVMVTAAGAAPAVI